MVSLCKSEDGVKSILDYIRDDFKSVPYLYVDVVKYGAGAPNVRTWIDYDPEGMMRGVYLLYYNCLHFFTRDDDHYPLETLLNAVEFLNPKVVMVQQDIGERLNSVLLSRYVLEKTFVMDFMNVGAEDREGLCKTASRDDIKKMVDIMMTEELYYSVYDRDNLEKQMLERYDDHFSSYFVIKDGEKLAAAYTTFAEVSDMVFLGSLIVNPAYRGKGYAARIINHACHCLSKEGVVKVATIGYDNVASLKLHEKLGTFPIGTLYKFVRIRNCV